MSRLATAIGRAARYGALLIENAGIAARKCRTASIPVGPTSTPIVPIVISPVLSRENEATIVLVVVPVLSPISQFSPENTADSAVDSELRLQRRDFALDLAAVETRRAGRNQLRLDLADGLDGVVDRRVGHIDRGAAEAERVRDRGHRHRCRTASSWRSTSRRRCRRLTQPDNR